MFFCSISLFTFCIYTFSLTREPVNALQILAIEYVPGKSHWNFMSAVLRALSDKGHNVTVFTPFPDGNGINYTEYDLSNDLPKKVAMDALETLKTFGEPTVMLPLLVNMTRNFCEFTHKNRHMQNILNNAKSNYDIVFAEVSSSECSSYVAAKLNLPLIYVIPSPMITNIEHLLTGHVPNPATVSHLMAHYSIPKTFTQRLINFVFLAFSVFVRRKKETELKKTDPQPYDSIEPLQSSLVFINTHYITDAPRPMPPNVIQVGGIHLQTSKNDVPGVSEIS